MTTVPLLGRHLLAPGTTFDRYTVLERVGVGGMGEVYAAYDSNLDRRVALKVLRKARSGDEVRLRREAQAMARLSHPNVVAVFDTGVVDGLLFVAMEFVQGTTLRAWQREQRPEWRQVLRVYVDAGRGLAAAHDAGLVHRDFKPDNVLISHAGTIKVTDFGLARALTGATPRSPARTPDPDAVDALAALPTIPSTGQGTIAVPFPRAAAPATDLGSPLTEAGALLGTPAYMAPEQALGEAVDDRADQFAFCVSLYEALFGDKPFAADDLQERLHRVLNHQRKPVPRTPKIPPHILRALDRGLEPNSADRHGSMDALLAELARDPARRRKQLGLATLGVAALATAAIWLQHETSDRKTRLCSAGAAEAALVWNADVKGRIERSMLATGVPYAADAWQRTRSTIDGYMTAWASMHKQTCEATRIQGEQPESVMAVRMACLDQRREEVRALGEILQDADRDVASRAVQAAMSLPRLDTCKDVTSLLSVQPEPSDPAIRAELESIREGLAGVRAEYEAGRYAAARDQADRLVGRARAARYHPVTAQALLWLAKTEARVGVPRAQCAQRGAEAVAEADAGRDDLLRVEAASRTMHWCSGAGQSAQAESWSRVAASALERAEGTGGKEYDLRKADWLRERCFLLTKERRLDDAVRPCEDAWDINSKGADLTTLVATASGLTDLYAALGRMRDAERIAGTADGEVVRLLGEEHPERITSLTDRAYVAGLAFDYQAAAGFAMQAVRVGEKVAPGSSALVLAVIDTCDSLARTGQAAAALPYCVRAVEGARRAYGADRDMPAEAHYSTGIALLALQRPADAIAEFEQTVAIYEKFGTGEHPTVAAALGGIGLARLTMGSARLGLPPLERALHIVETIDLHTPSDRVVAAEIRFTLARSLAEVGGPAAHIEQLARASAKSYVDLNLGDRARAVDDWLANR